MLAFMVRLPREVVFNYNRRSRITRHANAFTKLVSLRRHVAQDCPASQSAARRQHLEFITQLAAVSLKKLISDRNS